MAFPRVRASSIAIGMIFLSSVALVFLDGRPPTSQGWVAYSLILGVGVGLIFLTWRWNQLENPPRVVLFAALIAMTARIVVGLFLIRGLPVFGYDQTVQRAGYVYFDAYKRDRDALSLARSELPLSTSFTDPLGSDQYGGMIFISAGVYRYLSPDSHRPLLITLLGAIIAAIGVILGWRFTRRVFGERPAGISVWLLALYPESVLLGSSQMREPFLITAFTAAFVGYVLWNEGHRKSGLLLLGLGVVVLALPLSPPIALTILASIGAAWLWEGRSIRLSSWALIGGGLAVILVGVLFAARSWGQLEGVSGSQWHVISNWWNNVGAQWRINLLSEQSLNLDNLLDRMPVWAQLPFLVLFGIAQPFLPAAVIAPGLPIWKALGILRSLSWYLLIPFLLYAPVVALRRKGWRNIITFMSLYVWVAALTASYRAPSYQWDNPRYRVVTLVIQAALFAWIWVRNEQSKDCWVCRIGIILAAPLLVISHWYLGRFYDTPSLTMSHSMILAVVLSSVILLAYLVHDFVSNRKSS